MSLLFPDPPRSFPGRRGIKILLRAAHVLAAALYVGAVAFEPTASGPWLWATIGTGGAILLLDLHETAAFFCQVRGLVLVAKIAALGTLHLFGEHAVWLLGALVLVSVLSSHAPGAIRHRVVLGSVRGAETHG